MKIIALDVGNTTGIAVHTGYDLLLSQAVEATVYHRLADSQAGVYLVEHYQPQGTSNPVPANIEGAARLRAVQLGAAFHAYQPSQAKALAPNDVLKRMGWDIGARMPHATDAARLIVCWALLHADPSLPLVRQARAATMHPERMAA